VNVAGPDNIDVAIIAAEDQGSIHFNSLEPARNQLVLSRMDG
jgi:hypothetical protein